MPQLRFYWDETPERADRIEALLDEIREERETRMDYEDTTGDVDDEGN
jgi:hypothetical protein